MGTIFTQGTSSHLAMVKKRFSPVTQFSAVGLGAEAWHWSVHFTQWFLLIQVPGWLWAVLTGSAIGGVGKVGRIVRIINLPWECSVTLWLRAMAKKTKKTQRNISGFFSGLGTIWDLSQKYRKTKAWFTHNIFRMSFARLFSKNNKRHTPPPRLS